MGLFWFIFKEIVVNLTLNCCLVAKSLIKGKNRILIFIIIFVPSILYYRANLAFLSLLRYSCFNKYFLKTKLVNNFCCSDTLLLNLECHLLAYICFNLKIVLGECLNLWDNPAIFNMLYLGLYISTKLLELYLLIVQDKGNLT